MKIWVSWVELCDNHYAESTVELCRILSYVVRRIVYNICSVTTHFTVILSPLIYCRAGRSVTSIFTFQYQYVYIGRINTFALVLSSAYICSLCVRIDNRFVSSNALQFTLSFYTVCISSVHTCIEQPDNDLMSFNRSKLSGKFKYYRNSFAFHTLINYTFINNQLAFNLFFNLTILSNYVITNIDTFSVQDF